MNPRATGSIFGINFSTNKYDILISTLESICYRLMYVKNKINEINKDYDFIISGGVIDLIPDYAQMLSDVLGTKIIIKDLKEATLKALGSSSAGISWKDIQVINRPRRSPTIYLSGKAREYSDNLGIDQGAVSISHTDQTAIAFVMGSKK